MVIRVIGVIKGNQGHQGHQCHQKTNINSTIFGGCWRAEVVTVFGLSAWILEHPNPQGCMTKSIPAGQWVIDITKINTSRHEDKYQISRLKTKPLHSECRWGERKRCGGRAREPEQINLRPKREDKYLPKRQICTNTEKTNIVRRQKFSMLQRENICQKHEDKYQPTRLTRQDRAEWQTRRKVRETEFKTWIVVFL